MLEDLEDVEVEPLPVSDNKISESRRLLDATDAFVKEPLKRNDLIKRQLHEFATKYSTKHRKKSKRPTLPPRLSQLSESNAFTAFVPKKQ